MSDVLTPVKALCGRSGRVHGTYSADAWPKFLKPSSRDFVCANCARVSQS